MLFDPGTEVYVHHKPAGPGATNQSLRLLRARPAANALDLVVEGRGGRTYELYVRSPYTVEEVENVEVVPRSAGGYVLTLSFDGPADQYVRRTLRLPLR